jgi:NAD(P)-dependent dehydrogenase (short-subunit alcohol dehydrogenase family)
LVNNAGVGVAGTVAQTSVADWDRTIAVNLTAVFHLCRLLVPPMVARGHGVIINVASIAGVVGLRNRAAYCASKSGVVGLTRALAADHAAQGLRVNAICPGTVETAWVDRIIAGSEDPEAQRAAMAARQLDGRMGTAEEVAAGILFLASPEARFVNGSALVMDGGLTAV